jgi:diphosphomevalonate decarboxylase
VKLPSISLPTFEGKYENCATFEDVFNVVVDSRTDITSIEKFNYLLLPLKGQAFQLVEGLPITTDNYSIAWNLLVDRYENKKLIVATHVRQLLGLKSISKEDVGEMRQFVNSFCGNLNALKALNLEQPLEDIILSQLVVERLDNQTRREWQMKQADGGFPSLKELITFMEQKYQVLETLKPSTNIVNAKETQGGKQQRRSPRDSDTFMAVTESKLYCVLNHIICLNVQYF